MRSHECLLKKHGECCVIWETIRDHVVFHVCISVQIWLSKSVDICCSNMVVVVSCGLVFTYVCVCYCLLWWVDIICMFVIQVIWQHLLLPSPSFVVTPPLLILLKVFVT